MILHNIVEKMTKFQLIGTGTLLFRNRKWRQFNNLQYCKTRAIRISKTPNMQEFTLYLFTIIIVNRCIGYLLLLIYTVAGHIKYNTMYSNQLINKIVVVPLITFPNQTCINFLLKYHRILV